LLRNKNALLCTYVYSFSTGLLSFPGPFVAMLVNKFGCRLIAVIGGLVTSLSLFASVFAPSIQFLYVTLGVTTGQFSLDYK